MDIYSLSRNFWNYSFENPEKIKPNHIAMYFFAIEHCNRLGWKEKFGFPTTMVMDAISIKSYNTFIKTLNDLIDYGFIKMVEKSKNQYSSNIIALSKICEANDKALDKAIIKHSTKQSESTVQSIDSIDIPIYNNTNLQIDNTPPSAKQKSFKQFSKEDFYESIKPFVEKYSNKTCKAFFKYWNEPDPKGKMRFQLEKTWSISHRLSTWKERESKFGTEPVKPINNNVPLGPWIT